MASRQPDKRTTERALAREERRASESASLSVAARAYTTALDLIADSVKVLSRGVRALDVARSASVSPDLVQYGVLARLRPSELQRAVHSVARDLQSKVSYARSSGLAVPDGTEDAYRALVVKLGTACDLVSEAIDEFGKSIPRSASRPPPSVRDLILSAARAASYLNRLSGRGRAASSVHIAAVHDEITSAKDVSFY